MYLQKDPGLRIRVVGQAPMAARVYELEGLRCSLCDEVCEAEAPPEVGEKEYGASAAAMIALLKYGSGVPWDRLERLEANLGIPLPASTQCEIVYCLKRWTRLTLFLLQAGAPLDSNIVERAPKKCILQPPSASLTLRATRRILS